MSPAVILPDLKGSTALVTGSSAGIGRAIAQGLLDQGARVFGFDRNADSASGTGAAFMPIRCDLADAADIARAFAEVRRQTSHLDHVVNVAGMDSKVSLEEGDAAVFDRIMNLNLRGYYLVIRESLGLLRQGRGKSIVNISSINYSLGVPKRSIYSASKAATLGLTRGLARELGREGIRINTVTPGWIFTERQIEEYFTGKDREKNLEYLYRVQSTTHHITPEDIANHVLFQLSSASRASTGSNWVVDAGWLLQ